MTRGLKISRLDLEKNKVHSKQKGGVKLWPIDEEVQEGVLAVQGDGEQLVCIAEG